MLDKKHSEIIKNKISRVAFTLAEVLIVLGIIGIVAEMTIPTLMNNVDEQVYKTGYRKAFSVAKQAWMEAANDDALVTRTDWGDASAKISNFNAYKTYFRVIKDCNNNNNSECWDASGDKYFQTLPNQATYAFIDSSGMAWSLCSNLQGNGAELLVDINGFKRPNKYGQDRFILFTALNDGTLGAGLPTRIMPEDTDYNYDQNICPSGNNHPCYYKSWLLGG